MTDYPEDAEVAFLVCDEIRREAGNKLTLLGLYTGGDVLVADLREGASLPSLALLFLFRTGAGEARMACRVADPFGTEIMSTRPAVTAMAPGVATASAVRLVPFALRLGEFTAELRLDDRTYLRRFSVRRDPGPGAP